MNNSLKEINRLEKIFETKGERLLSLGEIRFLFKGLKVMQRLTKKYKEIYEEMFDHEMGLRP